MTNVSTKLYDEIQDSVKTENDPEGSERYVAYCYVNYRFVGHAHLNLADALDDLRKHKNDTGHRTGIYEMTMLDETHVAEGKGDVVSGEGVEGRDGYWSYDVDKTEDIWVFEFNSEPESRFLRLHLSPDWAPFSLHTLNAGDRMEISKGQWLEGYVDGLWSTLSGADHR